MVGPLCVVAADLTSIELEWCTGPAQALDCMRSCDLVLVTQLLQEMFDQALKGRSRLDMIGWPGRHADLVRIAA